MTLRTLIKRSLRFHWRSHLGVVLGAAIGSAALIGALIVGDSVKGSLRERALERLGLAAYVMASGDRYVRENLAQEFSQPLPTNNYPHSWLFGWQTSSGKTARFPYRHPAATLIVNGVAANGNARANQVAIIATVPSSEWQKRGTKFSFIPLPDREGVPAGEMWINEALANQLKTSLGDEVLLRIRKDTRLASDSAVSTRSENNSVMRLKVMKILPASRGGNFDINASSLPVFNAFVNLRELQAATGLDGRVNRLLLSWMEENNYLKRNAFLQRLPNSISDVGSHFFGPTFSEAPSALALSKASEMLANAWSLEDAEVACHIRGHSLELNTTRVFLDPPVIRSALAAAPNAQPVLTYLANLITVGSNSVPYSMVTAAGAPWTPPGLRDDEIILNQWLADDLQAKPGDALTLVYFDPESGARLTERTNTFRVHSIVPMTMPWADRTLMPQFPGIEKAETTAEWDTAFPLVHKIRPQDDEYWTDHRGTPKAFITLAAGQKMWANRFGNLTAIRFPIPTNAVAADVSRLHSDPEPTPSPSKEGSRNLDAPTNGVSVPLLGGVRGGSPGSLEPTHVGCYDPESFRAALEKKILATLKPEELGLRFEPVREQALKAAEQSQDFGGLFIGFSLFVIVAALLLMAMLFQFSLEQRATEVGTLLALGFTPKQVRRLLLREGAMLAFIGGILGTLGGIGYAKAMLHGLTTIWRDAVGASSLKFFVTPQTLAIGLFASTLVAVFTLWIALRKQARRPARELLTGTLECCDLSQPSPLGRPVAQAAARSATRGALVSLLTLSWGSGATSRAAKKLRQVAALQGGLPFVVALGLIAWAIAKGDTANAGIFFGAGALVLVAGLAFVNARLAAGAPSIARLGGINGTPSRAMLGAPITLGSLAVRGLSRRRSRSVATVALIASGVFLIVSIGVFRLDANRDATQRSSGTGGFALIGESTMPVVADLNTKAGLESFALNEADFKDVNVVQFRVRAGDEASCLNLNRAQKPRLLGVKPEMMGDRFTFAKGTAWTSLRSSGRESAPSASPESWSRLTSAATETNEIPAIGDANSIQWAMGKKVGDTLDYMDERGQPFKVRIVGAVANSILQGQLIIDEAEFVKRFPGESGYKFFLIDAPTNRIADVSAKLSRALQDAGLELTPAPQRLAQFNAVQNTYLGTFQILGGLGLLLGSAGLGIVVLRNVLERRGELAVLLAVGWLRQRVRRMVLIEHAALLGLGLAIGIGAATVAVLPSLLTPGAGLPWVSLGATLLAICANGFFWAWLATRVALRGNLLVALRGE